MQFFGRLQRRWPDDWRDLVANLTKYYGWGPRDAWSLTWTEMQWWANQAIRMSKQE